MGMAASQARLLCITARIHDVEYQAQAIQAAKVQLATQSDRVYQDYLEALDATTLTLNSINTKTGEKSLVAATFNNLCSRNKLTPADGSNYAIRNSQGLLLVEDDIEEGYYDFTQGVKSDDPYEFALFMIDANSINTDDKFSSSVNDAEENVFATLDNDTLTKLHEKLLELVGSDADSIYDINDLYSSEDEEKIEEYETTLKKYKSELYRTNAGAIYAEATQQDSDYDPEEDFDTSLFNYYVNIFKQIQAYGGCVSIEEYSGPNGNASNNSEWLTNMVQSGQFTIEIVSTDKSTGEIVTDATSPSSDTSLAYTETSYIDNRAVAKAEAEYNHKLKQIDKKDEQFDLDLSKLETERTALTTEYESVKKVIEDNIDRTFGIFS